MSLFSHGGYVGRRLERVISVSMPLDMSFEEILSDESLAATIRLTTVDPLWFMVQRVSL
jgi:hypothetical protein